MIDTTLSWMSQHSGVAEGGRAETLGASSIDFEAFLLAAPDAILLVDASAVVVIANEPAGRMFGCARREQLLGRSLGELVLERPRRDRGQTGRPSIVPARGARTEWLGRRDDGTTFPVEMSLHPLRGSEPELRYARVRDVSEQGHLDAELRASRREKALLLREVQHRVKNNLQIISSMLRLQRDKLSDPRVMELCKESQMRVRSMALFHETLHRSTDLARIDSAEYFRSVATGLFSAYGISVDRVELTVSTDDVWLGMDSAILCGLIINELVSNSLKHGVSSKQDGRIEITLRRQGRDVMLGVQDDGVGFPEAVVSGRASGLGLDLVRALAHQLHGEVELVSSGGARIFIRFPAGARA